MLLASDGIDIGEKWTTVLPSKIDVDFFYSVKDDIILMKYLALFCERNTLHSYTKSF